MQCWDSNVVLQCCAVMLPQQFCDSVTRLQLFCDNDKAVMSWHSDNVTISTYYMIFTVELLALCNSAASAIWNKNTAQLWKSSVYILSNHRLCVTQTWEGAYSRYALVNRTVSKKFEAASRKLSTSTSGMCVYKKDIQDKTTLSWWCSNILQWS